MPSFQPAAHDRPTNIVSEEMKTEYRNLLRDYRLQQSPDPIANRRPWHCEIAIQELLAFGVRKQQLAKESGLLPVEIRVLTSSCPNHVYGRGAAEGFEKFLAAGGILKVLIWNESLDTEDGASAIAGIAKSFSDQVAVRISGTSAKGETLMHFFVVGDQAYRLESPHKTFRASDFTDFSPEIPARICFNDQNTGTTLVHYFDHIWNLLPECELATVKR